MREGERERESKLGGDDMVGIGECLSGCEFGFEPAPNLLEPITKAHGNSQQILR